MRIRHIFPSTTSRATVNGDRAFFLRNQVGDLLTFYTTPQSRYEGWFIQKDELFFKLLSRINIIGPDNNPLPVSGITLTGSSCFWEYENGLRLGWRLLGNLSGLTLATTTPTRLRIELDIRPMYGSPTFGREYVLTQEEDGYLIRYTDPELSEPIFLSLRTRAALEPQQSWHPEAYPRDVRRHSPPAELFTFHLGEIRGDSLSLGGGWTAEEARQASLAASKLRPQPPEVGINYVHNTLLSQMTTAKASVTQALRWLQTEEGIYAGLPWFHQVWTRDELIAALGYTADRQREVIEQYLGRPLQNGELPTFEGSGTTCADGVGWLCLLAREHGLEGLPTETQERLVHFLTAAGQGLQEHRQATHGLIFSESNSTWMDTIGRAGFRLEIQCMYALLLEVLFSLTGDQEAERERLRMLGRIREHFWQGDHLKDGLGDTTVRPNIFLAYLLQPDLLSLESWQAVFDTALQVLHCPWGGLSSLDFTNPQFRDQSTGQDNLSYHNGDSWFFINNLAAIAMHRLNHRRYGQSIVEILQSSTKEILWENMLGQPGEISSASTLESFGCGIQAFSGGTYLALLKEMEDYPAGQGEESTAAFWDSTSRFARSR